MNTYTSQQVFSIRMQPKQLEDTPILKADNNASENFGPHEDKESPLEEQDIEEDKSLDTENQARDSLSGYTLQAELLGSKLLSSLREVRFNDQEFVTNTSVSNIKYNLPRFENNNSFYPFHDQLNYRLAKYFAESETSKSNVDKFLSKP